MTLAPDVIEVVRIGLVQARGVRVTPAGEALRAEIARVSAEVRARYAGRQPAQIEELQAARDLFRRTGVDPTRTRPSSEALLRRVLRGEDLPAINVLVDVSNLCSLEFLLPIGLYDTGRVRGDLVLRLGGEGEGYDAIGKAWYRVDGRLTLADADGPCGSPASDSVRTMITAETREALMVMYAPANVPAARMAAQVANAAERLGRYAGSEIVGTDVQP